jgi:hypothetical protein
MFNERSKSEAVRIVSKDKFETHASPHVHNGNAIDACLQKLHILL